MYNHDVGKLTAQLYPHMKDGPSLLVEGHLAVGQHIWHVAAWLHRWRDGAWHLGLEDDPPGYRFQKRIHASIPARCGCHREPSITTLRELAAMCEIFANKGTIDLPLVASTTQAASGQSRRLTIMVNPIQTRCAIFTHYGRGERCSKRVAPGRDICASHIFLESKLGPLPRQPVTASPVETPAPMIARTTPDAISAADCAVPAAKKATTKKARAKKADPVAAAPAVPETVKAS